MNGAGKVWSTLNFAHQMTVEKENPRKNTNEEINEEARGLLQNRQKYSPKKVEETIQSILTTIPYSKPENINLVIQQILEHQHLFSQIAVQCAAIWILIHVKENSNYPEFRTAVIGAAQHIFQNQQEYLLPEIEKIARLILMSKPNFQTGRIDLVAQEILEKPQLFSQIEIQCAAIWTVTQQIKKNNHLPLKQAITHIKEHPDDYPQFIQLLAFIHEKYEVYRAPFDDTKGFLAHMKTTSNLAAYQNYYPKFYELLKAMPHVIKIKIGDHQFKKKTPFHAWEEGLIKEVLERNYPLVEFLQDNREHPIFTICENKNNQITLI
jgi:hypothetical protein